VGNEDVSAEGVGLFMLDWDENLKLDDKFCYTHSYVANKVGDAAQSVTNLVGDARCCRSNRIRLSSRVVRPNIFNLTA